MASAADRQIPENIRRLISGKEYRTDDTGRSGAKILVFDDCVLKIERTCQKNVDTVRVMRWLEGKLPVPRVIRWEQDAAYQYLLMSKVPGRMSCDERCMSRPRELIERLAEALMMLWSVDIHGCPRTRDPETELNEARYRVENHLVDVSDAQPDTFGPGGFRDPEALLLWLEDNRATYEPTLSHGDLCLPNIFLDGGRVSGFIDLGATGVGDRWRDIALCYRSLRANAAGAYGGRTYPDVEPDMLFSALGIAPDREKIRYFILLDELL